MTLSKRALLVIFPVVLFSNLLVALSVYWIERSTIESSEVTRLSQQMGSLTQRFEKELDFTRNLVFMMRAGDAIPSFVREADKEFRMTGMGVKVQDGIGFFSGKSNPFVSFAILQPNLDIEYYFEKSDDPFASIHPVQLEAARRLVSGSALSSDEFVEEDGQAMVIHSELIDRTTLSTPLATQRNFAFVVQAAVLPEDFLQLKTALEKEYGSEVVIRPRIEPAGIDFNYVGRLLPDLQMGLELSKAYMAERLRPLKLTLTTGCLVLSLTSVGLLLFLIRRNITGPITRLDRQVTEVFAGLREHLDQTDASGEIGRLSANIKSLHDGALDTLQKVQLASWTDPLTGISNRLHFSLTGQDYIEAAGNTGQSLSLLFIDLDNFKFVNDTFGHAAGDTVLRQFTVIARDILDLSDDGGSGRPPMLARLSGDEFAILMWEPVEDGAARRVAAEIVQSFTQGLKVGDENYPVSASIGIACFPNDASSFANLISCADQAMYRAKSSGKNGFSRFSQDVSDRDRRVEEIEAELRRMNPDDEFSLLYMPIVSREGDVQRCEALLRWHSPVLGHVSPCEFIPIAESRALFSKIDRWVLSKAMSELQLLQSIFGPDTVLAVNMSSAELHSTAIVDHGIELLKRYGISATSVEIELTETFAIKAPARAKNTVQALKDVGFGISLDDFGAGYTSLKQILEFPLDTVKLDRALVEDIGNPSGLEMLRAIIALCHSQGCVVVAEGVEDAMMQAALRFAGCDLFQGFGICYPSTLAELAKFREQTVAFRTEEGVGAYRTA